MSADARKYTINGGGRVLANGSAIVHEYQDGSALATWIADEEFGDGTGAGVRLCQWGAGEMFTVIPGYGVVGIEYANHYHQLSRHDIAADLERMYRPGTRIYTSVNTRAMTSAQRLRYHYTGDGDTVATCTRTHANDAAQWPRSVLVYAHVFEPGTVGTSRAPHTHLFAVPIADDETIPCGLVATLGHIAIVNALRKTIDDLVVYPWEPHRSILYLHARTCVNASGSICDRDHPHVTMVNCEPVSLADMLARLQMNTYEPIESQQIRMVSLQDALDAGKHDGDTCVITGPLVRDVVAAATVRGHVPAILSRFCGGCEYALVHVNANEFMIVITRV